MEATEKQKIQSKKFWQNEANYLIDFEKNYRTEIGGLTYSQVKERVHSLSAPKLAWNPRLFEVAGVEAPSINLMIDEFPKFSKIARFIHISDKDAPAIFVYYFEKNKA